VAGSNKPSGGAKYGVLPDQLLKNDSHPWADDESISCHMSVFANTSISMKH
jgi:hypothetical protein